MTRNSWWVLGLMLMLGCASVGWAQHGEGAHGEATGAVAAEHGAAAKQGDAPVLEAQLPLAFWTVVVFCVLLFVLGKYAWGPLSRALDEREKHQAELLQKAEHARDESERMLAEHRLQMAKAKDDARTILDEARRMAETNATNIVAKAQSEAADELTRAKRDIATARDQALIEIWGKTADLAVSVAGRVLSKELTGDEQRRFTAAAISEIPSSPPSSLTAGEPVA